MESNSIAARALTILENIDYFKVCCGCDSITILETAICPVCSSYRFETESRSVIEQVERVTAPGYKRTTVLPSDLI